MRSLLGGGDGLTSSERDIRVYLDAVYDPGAQGWVHGGYGIGPDLNGDGKIRFTRFLPELADWPAEADLLQAELARCAAIADVYVCPYLLSGESRSKGTSVARPVVHCDGDDGVDLAKARTISGVFVVGSGTPVHGHVYVALTRSVPQHHHEALCKGLAVYLGAKDPKFSDNDVLRPPGTLNHKPTVYGGEPVPVEWLIRSDGVRADPEELAGLLGVELTDTPPQPKPKAKSQSKSGGGGSVLAEEVEAFDLRRYPRVRRALAKVTGDRSADTMHVVGACARSGLTEANARWAVSQRPDLAGRLLDRKDDDVERCWGRVEASKEERNVARRFRT